MSSGIDIHLLHLYHQISINIFNNKRKEKKTTGQSARMTIDVGTSVGRSIFTLFNEPGLNEKKN